MPYLIRSSASSVGHSNTHCHVLTCLDCRWCDLEIRVLECCIRPKGALILQSVYENYCSQSSCSVQSISKGKQGHSFKVAIGPVDHGVVGYFWNLQRKQSIVSLTSIDLRLEFMLTWLRLAGHVLGSLPAGLTAPVNTSTRALPPV